MNVDVPFIVNQISTPVNTSGILGVMSPAALPLIDVACCVPLVRRPLTAEAATDLARTLKAIAEACVCDLTEPLGLTQPTVSHHLKVLVDAGLLTRDKRGVWAYFTLVPGALDSLADVLSTQGAGAS